MRTGREALEKQTVNIDKVQLLDHLDMCILLSNDANVKQVLANLKQDVEDGAFSTEQYN